MVYINKQGYLERKINGSTNKINDSAKRNWWFGVYNSIWLGRISIPKRLQGKRLRFKIEIE